MSSEQNGAIQSLVQCLKDLKLTNAAQALQPLAEKNVTISVYCNGVVKEAFGFLR